MRKAGRLVGRAGRLLAGVSVGPLVAGRCGLPVGIELRCVGPSRRVAVWRRFGSLAVAVAEAIPNVRPQIATATFEFGGQKCGFRQGMQVCNNLVVYPPTDRLIGQAYRVFDRLGAGGAMGDNRQPLGA